MSDMAAFLGKARRVRRVAIVRGWKRTGQIDTLQLAKTAGAFISCTPERTLFGQVPRSGALRTEC